MNGARTVANASFSSRGFTLTEVLVAIGLVALFLLPLMGIFGQGALLGADAGMRIIATALAQERMEELYYGQFASIAAEARAPVASPGFGSFDREVVLTTTGTGNLKDVGVRVYWRVGSREQQVELRTLVADLG